jgi:hypothetical protein
MLQSQNKVYDQNIDHIRKLYSKDYHIWFNLNGHESRWKVEEDASKIIKTVIEMHQAYHWNVLHDIPAIVSGLHTKISKMAELLGNFQDYCPVSMVDHQQLQKCSIDSLFLAEYQVVSSFFMYRDIITLPKAKIIWKSSLQIVSII